MEDASDQFEMISDRNLGTEGPQVKEVLIEQTNASTSNGELNERAVDVEPNPKPKLSHDGTPFSSAVVIPGNLSDFRNSQVPRHQPNDSTVNLLPISRTPGFRSLVAFWILGLCNNYGYVVMLSAAHDIIGHFKHHDGEHSTSLQPNPRNCNPLSTGAILLADILPSLCVKITMPFLPLCVRTRIAVGVGLAIAGYLLVALAVSQPMAIAGVVCTAASSGLGEVTLVTYMSFYVNTNVILAWSSGTGAAGLFGALFYALPTSLGIAPATLLLILTIIPASMGLVFYFLLEHPSLPVVREGRTEDMSFNEKLSHIPNLLHFMIPIGLVYFFEYFINQGLHELVNFDGTFLTHEEQYRWYQLLYQTGVFISRSSVSFYQIDKLALLAVLQGINVIFFIFQAIYAFVPQMIIIMVIILWEGLLGGASYVNTLHKMNRDIVQEKREFSMAIVTFADALGISLAGLLAIPVHNSICGLPKY